VRAVFKTKKNGVYIVDSAAGFYCKSLLFLITLEERIKFSEKKL
jgi:hypothetical protein